MDRHTFRGKRLDNGEWVEGYLAYPRHHNSHRPHIGNGIRFGFEHYGEAWEEVDRATVGQCTGLKDKNGRLIFEGDIVKVNKLTFNCSSPLPKNLIVVFESGMFQLSRNDESLMGLHLLYLEDGEIIGNVHDTPELLEATT